MACRASTTIMGGQCGVPDLNRDHRGPVLRAGPQLRSCAFSVACTSRMSERMSEDMSERMSEEMSERILTCLHWHVYVAVFDFCSFIRLTGVLLT